MKKIIGCILIIIISIGVVSGEDINYILDEEEIVEATEKYKKENPDGHSKGCLIIAEFTYRIWDDVIKSNIVIRPPYIEGNDRDKELIDAIIYSFYYEQDGVKEILTINGVDINKTDLSKYGGVISSDVKIGPAMPEYIVKKNSELNYYKEIDGEKILIGRKEYIDELVSSKGLCILINGEELYTDVKPYIKDGRIMLPFRAVFEALGAEVGYNFDGENKEVYAINQDINLKMYIGNVIATKNDREIEMDVAPEIIMNRTFVPLRYASEMLSFDVLWIEEYRTALITMGGK